MDIMQMMKKAGCRLIIPGIESGNEQILKNIKKGSNLKLIREYMKNAKKAVKVIAKKNESNNNFEASMKTAIKNVEKAVLNKDKAKASENLKTAIKKIDKAASKGVAQKNFVARNKSRLSKKVNEME